MDRISELPEPILQQILSYLPIKQVVQSTLFSTTWKHVCSTFPILQFDKTYFHPEETENLRKKGSYMVLWKKIYKPAEAEAYV